MTKHPKTGERLLSFKEAAAEFGIKQSRLQAWVSRGVAGHKLSIERIGGRKYLTKPGIERFLATCRGMEVAPKFVRTGNKPEGKFKPNPIQAIVDILGRWTDSLPNNSRVKSKAIDAVKGLVALRTISENRPPGYLAEEVVAADMVCEDLCAVCYPHQSIVAAAAMAGRIKSQLDVGDTAIMLGVNESAVKKSKVVGDHDPELLARVARMELPLYVAFENATAPLATSNRPGGRGRELTLTEAAELVGGSVSRIYNWLNYGERGLTLRRARVDSAQVTIWESELLAFLERLRAGRENRKLALHGETVRDRAMWLQQEGHKKRIDHGQLACYAVDAGLYEELKQRHVGRPTSKEAVERGRKIDSAKMLAEMLGISRANVVHAVTLFHRSKKYFNDVINGILTLRHAYELAKKAAESRETDDRDDGESGAAVAA